MIGKRSRWLWYVGLALVWLGSNVAMAALTADAIQVEVKEIRLDNGMLFLVVERPTAPQVAVRLAIRAGSALEQAGKTGIAHMLEHMLFKGTQNFGTLDLERDRELQQRIDAAYQVVQAERIKRQPDQQLIKAKLEEMSQLRSEVQQIYVPQAFSSQLGKNGAVGVNAFTSKDQTQYVASVPSDMLEQWFSIISEQVFEPAWREFYVEKEVVMREWAFRYINNPSGAAWLDLHANAYKAHPYRNPVIGWKADMRTYSTDDAREFHTRFYTPNNAVCVVAGDVQVEEVRRLAQTYFARYPSGRPAPEVVTREPEQTGPGQSVRYLKGARTPVVRIGFHGAPMGTDDFYALDALTMLLSQGRSARITRRIVEQGLAQGAWAYNPDNRYGTLIVMGGSPNEPPPPADGASISDEARRQAYLEACQELTRLLLQEVAVLKREPVSEAELDRIKKLNERDFLDRLRSNESMAGTLATLEVQIGWQYLNTYLKRMAAITPADVQRVARQYFQERNRTTVYILPGGDPDQPPEPYTEVRSVSGTAAANFNQEISPVNRSAHATPAHWRHPLSFAREPRKIDYPDAQEETVNAVTTFYMPDFELPLVDLTLLFKAGEVDLPDNRIGLPDVLSDSIIRGGTATYPPEALARYMDANAIRIGVSVGDEVTRIHLSVLRNDWEKGLALVAEILTAPRFAPEVLAVVKQQHLTGLKRQSDSAQAISMREGMIWHFKGHPYGRDSLQGLETIPALSREDLQQFMTTRITRSNLVAAVSGGIEKEQALTGLETLFAALPAGPAPDRRISAPSATPPVLALIHKPGQVQTQAMLLLPSVQRSHPDYWKISLLTNILGGNDSLLYKRLRDDMGLVYSTGFYQTFKWQAGLLAGYIGCRADATPQAIRETLNLMQSLHQEVPAEEFRRKRLDVLNSFVFNVDSPAKLVDVYATYHLRNEPADTLERIQDVFINAQRKELQQLALTYLRPEAVQIFITADKTIQVQQEGDTPITLEQALQNLARELELDFTELALR